MDVIANILNNISSCGFLLLSDVTIGILKERMDLVNYVIILGKRYLWSCRHKDIKPSNSHFQRILKKKYQIEKYIEDITRWREDMNFIFEWQNNILRTSAASE